MRTNTAENVVAEANGGRKNGRHTKLTPDLQEKICSFIAEGNYLITACAAVGISKSTFLLWMRKAEDEVVAGEGRHLNFMLAVKRAEAEAEVERVARIRAAGEGGKIAKIVTFTRKDGTEVREETYQPSQWLADMTHLERRHPERWGRKDRTAITIDEQKHVTITHVEVVKDYGQGAQVIENEAREIPEKIEGGKKD